MNHRFRDVSDEQLAGLYFHVEAAKKGKTSFYLENPVLCALFGVKKVRNARISQFASSAHPFVLDVKIHAGSPKTATFTIIRGEYQSSSHSISDLPDRGAMEKSLHLTIREVETERQHITVVKKSSFYA